MFKTTVMRTNLLTILQANRDAHRETFLKAQAAFRERAIQEFDARLERARNGDAIDLYVRLPVPEEHTDDYDRAIGMLEMSTEEKVELTEDLFARYVQDEWGWRDAWVKNTTSYVAGS